MQQQADSHHLVVFADTLVYFGALDEAMCAAATTLVPGGWLCFTLEALGDDETGDHGLQHHGRYARSRAYVDDALQ